MTDSVYRCISCQKSEKDKDKIVLCAYCCRCEHLTCKGVFGPAAETLRKTNYFCSVKCIEIAQRSIMPAAEMEHTLREEIRNILNEVQKVHTKLDSKMDALLDEVKTMKAGYKSLKHDVEELQLGHDAVNETISGLQVELDRINRAAICNHYGSTCEKRRGG